MGASYANWAIPSVKRTNSTYKRAAVLLSARPSRDGKQIFAVGTKRRGELVRYDMRSRRIYTVALRDLGNRPNFSRDGKWVAYSSYPDHTLWRSRSDGSERMQLTYPPMEVGYPVISPDGTKVAFDTSLNETYVVSMDGGLPQRIVEKNSIANFSPDGNLLVMTSWADAPVGEKNRVYLQTSDLRTGKLSVVPSSQGLVGGLWFTQDNLAAANEEFTKLLTFVFCWGLFFF